MIIVPIKRSEAARMFEEIREILAGEFTADTREQLLRVFERRGVWELEPCTGEAHSNPHIDNCPNCMPRWGLVGPKIEVR